MSDNYLNTSRLVFIFLTIVFFFAVSKKAHADTPITGYHDEQGNLWEVYVSSNNIAEDFYRNPTAYISSLYFKKNGMEFYAPESIQRLFLKSITSEFNDFGIDPIGSLPEGDSLFDSDDKYWVVSCGFTVACQLAKLDFDANERKLIYKELLYNIVTSAEAPFLLGESYVELKDGTNLFSSALANDLVAAIEVIGDTSNSINDSHDLFEKAAQLIARDPNIVLPDVFGINTLAEVVSGMSGIADTGLSAYQYVLLREFVANSHQVQSRLNLLEQLVSFLQSNNTLDAAFLDAFIEVKNAITNERVYFSQVLANQLTSITVNNIQDKIRSFLTSEKFILATLKRAQKSFHISSKLASNITKIAPAVASTVDWVFDGYSLYSSTTETWRKIFLAYTINRQLDLFQSNSSFYSGAFLSDIDGDITYNSLSNSVLRDFSDIAISASVAYYSGILSTVDSNWDGVAENILDGVISSLSTPQLYALHFSSAAISFGDNLGAGFSQLGYSSEINSAKDDLEGYVAQGRTRGIMLGRWSSLLTVYDIENKPGDNQEVGSADLPHIPTPDRKLEFV